MQLFQSRPGHSSFQDAIILLCIDIQRLFIDGCIVLAMECTSRTFTIMRLGKRTIGVGGCTISVFVSVVFGRRMGGTRSAIAWVCYWLGNWEGATLQVGMGMDLGVGEETLGLMLRIWEVGAGVRVMLLQLDLGWRGSAWLAACE
jgi:hypothetical protein